MKVTQEIGKRNHLKWIVFNLIPIVTMVFSLAFPLPIVQAQSVDEPSIPLLSPSNGIFMDNKKPLACSSGDHCALQFNGINQWVEEDQFRGFDTASFTFETWVKWSGDGQPIPEGNEYFSGVIPLIALGEDSVRNASDLKLVFGIDSESGTLFTGFFAHLPEYAQSNGYHTLAGNTPLTDGSWHHVATTFDGQILRLFLDGELDAELDLAEPVLPDLFAVRNVTIAAALPRLADNAGFFKGALDEVRIWEIARTQPELLAAASLENLDDLNLIGYWTMNEGKGSELKDSSGKGKNGAALNEPTWTDGTPMMLSAAPIAESLPSIDAAPNGPTLVSPDDGDTNVSTSPSLNVNVSDSDGGNLTATFYGKIAENSVPDFSIIVLPDTQLYSKTKNINGIFQLQAQWVVSQLTTRNIAFVGHLGDTIDDYNVATEWAVTDAAMKTLEGAGIPYGISPGNCDEDNYGVPPGTTWFNRYFPVSRFAGRSYYGGAYNNDNANSYQLISASGLNFIIIEIKYNVSYNTTDGQAILAWANNLLQIYSNRRAIVITHNLLTTSNILSTDGNMIYNALKGNPNLFLMMGGHLDTEGMRTDPGTDGHTIYSLRSDYQTRPNGGNGWLRILRFSPDNNKIYVTTYSPYLDQFETDADSQFSLDYNMGGAGYDEIGSVTVPSGFTASVTWSNLVPQTQYQWYVTVNDGTSTTTGPTWTFTTSGGQSAPVVTTQPVNQTVNAGQQVTFTAAASGSPTPTTKWQVSTDSGSTWNDISGATTTSYSFTTTSADNGKQFRAVFTNSLGSASSNAATLTVNTPPAVTTQPVPLTVNAGQTAVFTAAASGSPAPTVQWQASTNGTTWTNITGATTPTYSFTAVSADNGKQFKAVFSNIAGTATTNVATLTVQTPPVVTTQPSSQTVTAGQTAAFTAAASGFPVPGVQWQVSTDGISWTNISGAISTTYNFVTSSADNGKQFHAVFTNAVGTATSSTAVLTVNAGPVITTNPTNLTVNASQTAAFTAAASGNPTPTVQWQVSSDGGSTWSNISGAVATTYSFTTTASDNGKQFRAVFTNTVGSATTNAAALTVNFAPAITSQPSNQTVNAGQTVSFTSTASGNPTPTVQWQVSTDGTLWTNIAGAIASTYSFTTATGDQGKQFHAVFTNIVGTSTSNAATLTVNTGPVITLNPANLTVVSGQTATFTAAASGSPTPTVQWQVSTNNGSTWTNISAATSTTYSFTTAASDNGKQYRAVFANTVGSATSAAAILTVNYAPTVTTQPSNQTVTAGQVASFSATASGNPAPVVQWQVSIDGVSWTNISGATSTTYSFTTTSSDNGKHYRAVFTNSVASANSNAALLAVNIGPVITVHPTNLTVTAGQTASFSAAASGTPAPTVQWQSSTNGTTWTNITGATSTTYSFSAASEDNGNQFRAVFSNSVGSATSSAAVLTVQTPPAVITQPNSQNVNSGQTVVFTATASGFPAPTVQWQVSPTGSVWSDITGATSTTLSFIAQAVDNGTQYRAVFTNAAGTSTSNPATLTVYTLPVITLQPVNTTVVIGKPVSFTAAASGNPTPTVQWQVSLDGTTWNNISGASSTTYSFTPAAGDNGNLYRAIFTNSVGSTATSAAVLTVYYGPSVTTQPANQSVIAGQIVTFSAAAAGNPAPSVHWEVSTDGFTWSDLAGETTSTLTFTAQISDNGKRYRAYFINSVNEVASNAAVLTVNAAEVPPAVTLNPVNLTVNAGQTAAFTASASGTPSPTVQWQVSTNGTTWNDITGATSNTYSFAALAGDNAKQYRAVFTNTAGNATTSAATLTVYTTPVVTNQPGNVTVNAGQSANFTAAASGNPLPTVQWQASTDGSIWTNISGATSAAYTFTTTSSDNGKQYRAVFTNSAGTATTNSATLTVNFGPTVTSQPSSQTVNAGQVASFTSNASGNPTPTVQWQLSADNGATWSNIAGATSTTYSFTTTSGDHGKQYRAVFSNSVAAANSNPAILTVNTGPVITVHPTNVTVNAGQTASFTAAASGNPTPTVQWQVSTDGTTWNNITGATSTSYAFATTSSDDGKQYRAMFSNAAGSAATNAALLTLRTIPVITSQPVSMTVTAGQSATFSADASGNPVPTVQWQVSTDNGSTWANISSATSKTYGFTTTAADNGKHYRAVFTNAAGSATTNSVLLTVNTMPDVTTHPSNLTVNEGQTATFTAAATGNPAPTVQWQSSPDGSTWTDIAGATTSTLSFTAQLADNGQQYRAVFTNTAGSAASNAATLMVQSAPVISTQPVDQTVNAGQTAMFTAAASGSPVATAQWQVSANGTTWSNITGATALTYTFTAQTSDNGKYFRVVFTNVVGTATSSAAILTVHYAPSVISQPLGQTVTAGQTATFTAAATGNPTPTVQWQLSTNNGSTWTDITGATLTTYSFTSAASDNGRQYRAVFTNSVGSIVSNAAVLMVNYPPQVTTQPVSQTVATGQPAAFTSLASGNPTPSVQWQASTDGVNWTNISGATSTTYSFATQAADNGKSFRAVFSNSVGTAASSPALLTVQNDLIFKDGFNTCNASAWNGGVVNSARLAFNIASGRNSTCGMAVTIQSSLVAYVADNTPSNETSYYARFYFMPNTLKMPNNTPITLFEANNAAGNQVIVIQLRWSGKTMQLRAGALSDANAWTYTNWTVITNTWQSVEVDWHASSSTIANDGSLTFWIDGIQEAALSGLNNDIHSINSGYLGAVAGLNNKMSGSFFIDDFESHRLTTIGQ